MMRVPGKLSKAGSSKTKILKEKWFTKKFRPKRKAFSVCCNYIKAVKAHEVLISLILAELIMQNCMDYSNNYDFSRRVYLGVHPAGY